MRHTSYPDTVSEIRFPCAVRARLIYTMQPGHPFLDNGVVIVDGKGRIVTVDTFSRTDIPSGLQVYDFGDKSLAPGLVNCHTHLEISHAQGKTVLGQGYEQWARSLIALPLEDIDTSCVEDSIRAMKNSGTGFVADITSRHPEVIASSLKKQDMDFHLFVEFIGFTKQSKQLKWPSNSSKTPSKQVSAAGHSLYSTDPGRLQMAKTWSSKKRKPFSLHLAEHAGEVEFLATGRGSFAELLKKRLVPANFVPPELSPVEYADQLGLLDHQTLAVHCVHVNSRETATLARRQTSVCLCPRSNAAIGVGRAPWEEFFKAKINLCLGTDSLASNDDEDLWKEASCLLRDSSLDISLTDLLGFLTINGARALGVDTRIGSIAPGKTAVFSLIPGELENMFKKG